MQTIIASLNRNWRVVDDPRQWILQRCGDKRIWQSHSYCRQRDALLRCIREHSGPVDSEAVSLIEQLPEMHPWPKT